MENMDEANIQLLTSIKQEKINNCEDDSDFADNTKCLNDTTKNHSQVLTDSTSLSSLIIKKEEPDDLFNDSNQKNGDCNDSEMLNTQIADTSIIDTVQKRDTVDIIDYYSPTIKQEYSSNTEVSVFQDMFIVSDFLSSKCHDFSEGSSHIDKKKPTNNNVKKSFQCPLCHLKFYKFTLFTKHAECHSTKDISLKVKNGNSFSSNSVLNFSTVNDIYHKDSVINSNVPEISDNNLDAPKKKKRIRKPYISTKMHYCDECEYSSNHLNNYRTHKRKHTGERPFSCDQCSYTSAQLVHLKSHKLIHTDDKPHLCFLCMFKTRDLRYLKRHNKRHLKDKRFDCNQCVFSCGDIQEWYPHNAIHTVETSLQCEACDFSCKRQDRLDLHVRIHSGETPYKCNECQYSCNDLTVLKKHSRTHIGKGPLFCDVCPYSTVWSRHMCLHKRTHTGEKPYACDKCDYTCSQIGHLKTHRRVHTGEKPYSCDLCDHTSSQVSHMKLHIMSHSDEKPFKCMLCTFSCKTGQDLRRHSKKHMQILIKN